MTKRKGPTWGQIHASGANNIESRPGSFLRQHRVFGRTSVDLKCPFCKATITAYVWSLPNGKRCDCGAMTGSNGDFHHFADRT
jgi:hypothetical protein